MLIKINSGEALDQDIGFLKNHFCVGSASKAVANAAECYKNLYEEHQTMLNINEILLEEMKELKRLVRLKEATQREIDFLCEEKL